MKKFIIFFLYLNFLMPVFAASDLIGIWTSTDGKVGYDFLEGFAPKMGVVIQYKNGELKKVDKYKITSKGLKIGFREKKYQIIKNYLVLGGKKFKKLARKDSEKLIELKKETQTFIENLVSNYWISPIKQETYHYKKGFSSTSGIYSVSKKGNPKSLGSWSFANGVIKIDSRVYPNGRIARDFLLLLTSRNTITLLKRGKKAPIFETIELKKKGKNFIRKLVSGRWMTLGHGAPSYHEFRPVFGDLSGVTFKLSGQDFIGSSKWEYSLKTGSIKIGYTEYPNAQIQGPFLILLTKNGRTKQMVRPRDEKVKEFTNAEVKRIKITETSTDTLKSLLGRQWYKKPNTYKFVFQENGKEGWLHSFRSYPFLVSGNTLNIKGLSKVKDVRFIDGKIVLGDDKQSYSTDSKIVYLSHQGKDAAIKQANLQKQKAKDSEKAKLVLLIKMKDGVSHRVALPIDEMKNIISLSLEPGM